MAQTGNIPNIHHEVTEQTIVYAYDYFSVIKNENYWTHNMDESQNNHAE